MNSAGKPIGAWPCRQALSGGYFSCRGHRAGKSRGGSQIAIFCHQKVPQGLAGEEWKKKIAAFIVDGGLNFTEENDEVLVVGFGCKGRAIFGDIPGVCFKVVKTDHVSLWPYSKARKRDYDSKF